MIKKITFILTFSSFWCLSCVSKTLAKTSTSNSEQTMQIKSQDKFKKMLEDPQAKEGWGLFSSGGWADDGQIVIIRYEDKKRSGSHKEPIYAKIFYAQVGAPEQLTESKIEMSPSDLQTILSKSVNFDTLLDFDSGAFDGNQYEYIHITKEKNNELKVQKTVRMNNPHLVEKATSHNDILNTFEKIKENATFHHTK